MARVLITGANRGIGLALSREFWVRGHQVVAGARHPARAEALEAMTEVPSERGGSLQVLRLDVTSPESLQRAYDELARRHQGLDILVNNAAVFPEEGRESLADLDLRHFDEAFAVNVTGVARMCQVFLPLLRRGDRPRIINISSGAGSISAKDDGRYYCYGASKAALNMFTRTLACEVKGEGILAAAISPGWVKTEMGGPQAEITPEESARDLAETVLGLTADQHGCFLSRQGDTTSYQW